jgi:hypothetical protein
VYSSKNKPKNEEIAGRIRGMFGKKNPNFSKGKDF